MSKEPTLLKVEKACDFEIDKIVYELYNPNHNENKIDSGEFFDI